MTFSVGDRVRCVLPTAHLVRGRVYEVTAVDDDFFPADWGVRLSLKGLPATFGFRSDRFERVEVAL